MSTLGPKPPTPCVFCKSTVCHKPECVLLVAMTAVAREESEAAASYECSNCGNDCSGECHAKHYSHYDY